MTKLWLIVASDDTLVKVVTHVPLGDPSMPDGSRLPAGWKAILVAVEKVFVSRLDLKELT